MKYNNKTLCNENYSIIYMSDRLKDAKKFADSEKNKRGSNILTSLIDDTTPKHNLFANKLHALPKIGVKTRTLLKQHGEATKTCATLKEIVKINPYDYYSSIEAHLADMNLKKLEEQLNITSETLHPYKERKLY
jgi:3-dehydroquinate synthetase